MEEQASIKSVEAVLESPAISRARVIEVSMCEVVHFRIHQPEAIFKMVEERLLLRNREHFKGYAAARMKMERIMRDASVLKKVEASCVGHSHWVPDRHILYSTELEIWMEMSYPNPLTLDLYHWALAAGKTLHVPYEGPFNKLFHQLLLQKNGFERLEHNPNPEHTIALLVGEPYVQATGNVHLKPEIPNQRPHAFSAGNTLGQSLANGTLIKDREEQLVRVPNPRDRYLRDVGYRLIGPTLVLLYQQLAEHTGPVGFSGLGSGFLSTLGESLRQPWPWLPEVTANEKADLCCSLFPDPKAGLSLLPDQTSPTAKSVLNLEDCVPAHLLLPPMECFFMAALKGPRAPGIQASASAFVRDFARITRGLQLPLPASAVTGQWRQQLLSPSSDLIGALLDTKALPGFTGPGTPWRSKRMIKAGPWPTATYLQTGRLNRWYVHLSVPERIRTIQNWRNELVNARTG